MSNRKSVSSRVACPTFIDDEVGPAGSSRRLTLAEFHEAWPWLEGRIVCPTLERHISRGKKFLERPARTAAGQRGDGATAPMGVVRRRLREELPDFAVDVFIELQSIAKSPRGLPASRAAIQALVELVVNAVLRSRAKEPAMLAFAAGLDDGAGDEGDAGGGAATSPEEMALACRTLEEVRELIGDQRLRMLADFLVVGMSQAEIGEELGRTATAVKLDIFRTLTRIAEVFGFSRNRAKSRGA